MNSTIPIKDFNLSAYLMASGRVLQSYKKESGTVFFCFDSSIELEQAMNKYYTQQAMVNPIAFANAQKTLKSIIFSNSFNVNEKYVPQSTSSK